MREHGEAENSTEHSSRHDKGRRRFIATGIGGLALYALKALPSSVNARSNETYVVTEGCVNCKYTDCAAVCPVEAFHEPADRLYINPDTCIACDACVPECPVEAIFSTDHLPKEYEKWIKLNQEASKYPVIRTKKPALHGNGCKGPPEKK